MHQYWFVPESNQHRRKDYTRAVDTPYDLVRIMNIPSERVTVIPHGAPSTPPRRKPIFDSPYLLYVGARWSYKNFEPFISECSHIIAQNPDLHVVCTGEPFLEKEMEFFTKLGIKENVINKPHVSEAQLQALYQHAIAFVYPSAYEGFGIPILEAFVNGCPVLLNNASCFPEIGEDAALYFDIKQEGDLAEHINRLQKCSNEERKQIIIRGEKRARQFSWQESAKKMKRIYNTLVANN